MSLADELTRLQQLHETGALNDEEFARAKAAVLPPTPSAGGAVELTSAEPTLPDQHLEKILLQNEIAQLDREWEIERRNYLVTGNRGGQHIPTEGGSIVVGIVVGVFGFFWTMMAVSMGAPALFPIFGVIFILFGFGTSIHSFGRARDYQKAYTRYQQRRARLIAKTGRDSH